MYSIMQVRYKNIQQFEELTELLNMQSQHRSTYASHRLCYVHLR